MKCYVYTGIIITFNQVLVQRNDSELLMIDELRRTIEHLEHEDNKKTEERHKYARDIEQVETHNVQTKTKTYYIHKHKL